MKKKFSQLNPQIKLVVILICCALVGTLVMGLIGRFAPEPELGRGFAEEIEVKNIDSKKGLLSEKQIEEKIWELNASEIDEKTAREVLKSLTKLNRYMMMTGGNMSIGEHCLKQEEVTFGECVQAIYDNNPELQSQFESNERLMKRAITDMENGGMQISDIPFIQDFFGTN